MQQRIVAVILFVSISFAAIAQTNASKMSSAEWMKMITANAVTKIGEKVHSGFALYYTKVGSMEVPYIVYVPAAYDASRPTSVVVFLHGAILARDNYFHHTDPTIADEPIFSVGDAFNTIVVFPFGKNDLAWSGQQAAYENIITIIGQVEQHYNVDRKKIYIGGISMGGIATFWFINNKPELFAGFYTFSALPGRGGDVKYSHITGQRPLYSMNAKDDQTFSYEEVHEIYEQHKKDAPDWHFSSVETGGHRFIYGNGGAKYVKEVLNDLMKK
jgi:predicted peptidase